MKNIFTFLTLFTFSSIFAIDRFVDPNLSSGNGTTLFTNITSAVAASVNGDRIIVASNTYNEATLTISKSLKIIPQTAGTTINFNANIIIAGFPGMKVEITGFNLGIYSFNSSAITGGSASNRSKISIINCNSEYLWFDNDFYQVSFIENQITRGIIFRNGNVVKNTTKQISLMDEPQDNPNTMDRNLIIANQVQFLIGVFNNDYPVMVANNSMRDLSFRRWNANANLKNYIINNEFTTDCVLHFSVDNNVPRYNIVFSSNNFVADFYMITPNEPSYFLTVGYDPLDGIVPGFDYNQWFLSQLESWYSPGADTPSRPNVNFGWSWSTNGSLYYFNSTKVGFFEFSYNGIVGNFNIPTSGSPLSLTNIQGQANDLDGGNPNHNYYDIDLTINDRGRNGGPYSLLNYNPSSNPNNSKAFIFDLDMPTDLFPGQNVNITAKGYHKN
jgi:hypothetical protein